MSEPQDFGRDSDRLEWQAQERALDAERRGADHKGSRGSDAEYRLIARALRQPPIGALPENFAAQMAARVGSTGNVGGDRLETWLVRGLLLAMVVGGIASVTVFGDAWLAPLAAQASGTAVSWIVSAVICLVLTLAVENGIRSRMSRAPRHL